MPDEVFKQGSLKAAAARAKSKQPPSINPPIPNVHPSGRMLTMDEKAALIANQLPVQQPAQPQHPSNRPANRPNFVQGQSHKPNKGKPPFKPQNGPPKFFCGHNADIRKVLQGLCKECKREKMERDRIKQREKKRKKRLEKAGIVEIPGGPPALLIGRDRYWRLPQGSMYTNILYTKEDEEGHKWEGSLVIAKQGWEGSAEYKALLEVLSIAMKMVDEAVVKGLVLKFPDTSSGIMKLLSKTDRAYRAFLNPNLVLPLPKEVHHQESLKARTKEAEICIPTEHEIKPKIVEEPKAEEKKEEPKPLTLIQKLALLAKNKPSTIQEEEDD